MMFRYVQLRWKISQLERKMAVERARARTPLQRQAIDGIGGSSEGVLLYNIREVLSDYLISEAHRLFIPLPDWDKQDKVGCPDTAKYVLTRDAINELRSAIRAEKKARAERFLRWVPGGILGAAIGLAAILIR